APTGASIVTPVTLARPDWRKRINSLGDSSADLVACQAMRHERAGACPSPARGLLCFAYKDFLMSLTSVVDPYAQAVFTRHRRAASRCRIHPAAAAGIAGAR